jgi:hypothetical protein
MLTIDCSITFETHHTVPVTSGKMQSNYLHVSAVIQHPPSAKTEEFKSAVQKTQGKAKVVPFYAVKAYIYIHTHTYTYVCIYRGESDKTGR